MNNRMLMLTAVLTPALVAVSVMWSGTHWYGLLIGWTPIAVAVGIYALRRNSAPAD